MSKKRRKTSGRVRKKERRSDSKEAKLAIKQGNYDKAIIILQSAKSDIQIERKNTALAELYFQRAHRYTDSHPEQALADFDRAASLKTEDALYAYHMGLAYHRNQQLDKAIEWYANSLERDNNFERAVFALALAHHENGDDVQNLPIWQRLTEEQNSYVSENNDYADDLLKGLTASDNKNWDVAETHFQAVITDKDNTLFVHALAYDHLGRLALRHDNTAIEQASNYWKQAYDNGSRSTILLDNLALAYVLRIEADFQANGILSIRDLLQEALQYFPEHPRLQEIQSYLQLQSGYDAANENNWKVALTAWESVKNAEGEVARRLAANMGLAYEKLDMWQAAADSWREFAKRRGRKEGAVNWLTPQQVARLWSRISSLYMRAGDEDEAITTLQTALKYDKDDLEMGVELARRYAEVGRMEASHNQIDRVTKKHKNSAKALAFKAELSEVAPQGWSYINRQAMSAWEKVIATDDESYMSIARENLKQLYLGEFKKMANWGFDKKMALDFAKEGLKAFPDFSYLRAMYIGALMDADKSKKEIQKQVNQIDITDEDSLHRLVDLFHIFGREEMASALLIKAKKTAPLTAQFYASIGSCAINREQYDLADDYFEDALELADNEDDKKHALIDKAMAYSSNQLNEKAEPILKDVLKQDRKFGPAHLAYAFLSVEKEDIKDAKWHLKKAERWAKDTDNEEILAVIEEMRFSIDNPFARLLPPGFDPSMLPPDFLDMALDGGFDMFDDFDDEDFG